MNRLLKAAAALLCACGIGSIAHAQLTTITASSISMGGVPIAAGTVTFTPVNLTGIAIPFATGGGGLNSPTAFSCTITAGAIAGGCQIPDAALTSPANLLYSVTITNTGTQKSFTMQQVTNITGTTWPLDHYGPPSPTTNVQAVQAGYGTAGPPSSCVSPSTYTQNSGGGRFYTCVGGVFVIVTDPNDTLPMAATSIGTLYGYGDSTQAGSFALPVSASMFSVLARDFLGNAFNSGYPGALMWQIDNIGMQGAFHAGIGTEQLPVIVINGGINDANTLGATTGALENYTLQLNALTYWHGLLPGSQIMASAATVSGFAATYTGSAVTSLNGGTPKQSTTVGDTLTFTGTAPAGKIGLTYDPRAAGTGTFTVKINGTLQTDACSGTTTFSAFGCNSQAVGGDTHARQEFSVTPGSTPTLIVTVTGTTGATNIVSVVDVDFPPASPAGLPTVILSGVLRQYLDADSTATAGFDTAAAAIATHAIADNLNLKFADVRAGSPGVNTTTDMAVSSAACLSVTGNTPLHPNACGYLHYAQTIENAAPGLFHPGLGGKPSTLLSPISIYVPVASTDPKVVSSTSNLNSLIPTAVYWTPQWCTFAYSFCTGIGWSATQSTYTMALSTGTTAAIQKCTGSSPAGCTDDVYWDTNGNQINKGDIQAGPTVAPTCAAATAGRFQYTQGNASTKDVVQVCAHDASNVYAWRAIY